IDRAKNPGKFSTVVISEGAKFKGMTPENNYRIGEKVAQKLHKISAKFNNGKKVDTIVQNLGYLVRSGVPDATDSIVPIAYGNIAMDIISDGKSGMMTALRDGVYTAVDLNLIDQSPKTINVEKFYDKYNLQPKIDSYMSMPQLIINGTTILSK
ncbi:MAG: phosphofructokinase, partial [Bacteroidales bacterium]|nr:phosphofructokinase [Bacteroidales bacterium]